jgi:hypothetical protein
MKNWKYKVVDEYGEITKNTIYSSPLSASQVCRHLELQGYEVLSISCVETFSLFNSLKPLKRKSTFYAPQ